jgi:hypothetical protein
VTCRWRTENRAGNGVGRALAGTPCWSARRLLEDEGVALDGLAEAVRLLAEGRR